MFISEFPPYFLFQLRGYQYYSKRDVTEYCTQWQRAPDAVINWAFIHSTIIFSTCSIIPFISQKCPVEKLHLISSKPEKKHQYFGNHKKGISHKFND